MLSGSASVAGLMDTPVKDDDQAPDIDLCISCIPTAMIREKYASETVVYTAEAVDPDEFAVRYALDAVSTPDNVYFTLDAENGDLRFRASPDYETPNGGGADGNEYWVSIIATQGITRRSTARRRVRSPMSMSLPYLILKNWTFGLVKGLLLFFTQLRRLTPKRRSLTG